MTSVYFFPLLSVLFILRFEVHTWKFFIFPVIKLSNMTQIPSPVYCLTSISPIGHFAAVPVALPVWQTTWVQPDFFLPISLLKIKIIFLHLRLFPCVFLMICPRGNTLVKIPRLEEPCFNHRPFLCVFPIGWFVWLVLVSN